MSYTISQTFASYIFCFLIYDRWISHLSIDYILSSSSLHVRLEIEIEAYHRRFISFIYIISISLYGIELYYKYVHRVSYSSIASHKHLSQRFCDVDL